MHVVLMMTEPRDLVYILVTKLMYTFAVQCESTTTLRLHPVRLLFLRDMLISARARLSKVQVYDPAHADDDSDSHKDADFGAR